MNKDFLEKANTCATTKELMELIKKEKPELTDEEMQSLTQSWEKKGATINENSELTDSELSEVSGGLYKSQEDPYNCTFFLILSDAENSTKTPDTLDMQICTEIAKKRCSECLNGWLCKCKWGQLINYSGYIPGVTKHQN